MKQQRIAGFTMREVKLIEQYEDLAKAGSAPPVDVFLRRWPRPRRRLRETLEVVELLGSVFGGSHHGGAVYKNDESKAL